MNPYIKLEECVFEKKDETTRYIQAKGCIVVQKSMWDTCSPSSQLRNTFNFFPRVKKSWHFVRFVLIFTLGIISVAKHPLTFTTRENSLDKSHVYCNVKSLGFPILHWSTWFTLISWPSSSSSQMNLIASSIENPGKNVTRQSELYSHWQHLEVNHIQHKSRDWLRNFLLVYMYTQNILSSVVAWQSILFFSFWWAQCSLVKTKWFWFPNQRSLPSSSSSSHEKWDTDVTQPNLVLQETDAVSFPSHHERWKPWENLFQKYNRLRVPYPGDKEVNKRKCSNNNWRIENE
jgi:hypothetical protein